MAEVLKVNSDQNSIETTIGTFNYDYLVIATGCRTNFFGNENLKKNAYALKSTYDAIKIRNNILQSFEDLLSSDESEKEYIKNIVIVGAGPTGVELAGAFAEIRNNILPKDFPLINFHDLNIYLLEGSPYTLSGMSNLARKASREYLESMGVIVLTNIRVMNYDGRSVELSSGYTIKSKQVIWAAGVTGNVIPGIDNANIVSNNRYHVDRYNLVKGYNNIYAVGDVAYMETPNYPKGHPQVANVAINQARNLARNLSSIEKGKPQKQYTYKNKGTMATIGKKKAVVDLPFYSFKGFFAWLIWMFLHLMLILSVRNKLVIFINWAWLFFTRDTSLRLILKDHPE
jgi:NADH dehydrogenase